MKDTESYPLEQLVVIKQKKLEEAERILREKKEILKKEEEKLHELEMERDRAKEHRDAKLTQLREKLDAGTATDKIVQMKQYYKIADEKYKQREVKVKEQIKIVDTARKNVETARQDLFKKHKDVEKLSIHRKEWEKERQEHIEYLEDVLTDEMGSAMDMIRKTEKKKIKKRHRHG